MKTINWRKTILAIILASIIGYIVGIGIGKAIVRVLDFRTYQQQSAQLRKVCVTVFNDLGSVNVPASNTDHGDSLEEVMYGIRDEEYEYAAVFYDWTKLLEVTCYDANSCSFYAEWPKDLAA